MLRLLLIIFTSIQIESSPVHFIPHSHDDLGWNWTIQEYYDKWVRDIFSTVLNSLE